MKKAFLLIASSLYAVIASAQCVAFQFHNDTDSDYEIQTSFCASTHDRLSIPRSTPYKDVKIPVGQEVFLKRTMGNNEEKFKIFVVNSSYEGKSLKLSDFIKSLEAANDANKTGEDLYYEAHEIMRKKQYAEAIPVFDEAIKRGKLRDNKKYAYFERGYCYYNLQMYDKARLDYNEDLRIDPTDATGYVNFQIGLCYFGEENYKEALKYFEKALEKKSDNADYLKYRDECKNLMKSGK